MVNPIVLNPRKEQCTEPKVVEKNREVKVQSARRVNKVSWMKGKEQVGHFPVHQ